MDFIKVRPKISEALFFVTGIGMILTLPWTEVGGFKLWFLLRGFYFVGIVIFLLERTKYFRRSKIKEE